LFAIICPLRHSWITPQYDPQPYPIQLADVTETLFLHADIGLVKSGVPTEPFAPTTK
jgi:hypothetical protein